MMIDFPEGDPPQQFADALVYCRRVSLITWESIIRDQVMNGTPRILRNPSTGEPVWEVNEDTVGLDDEAMQILGMSEPTCAWHRIKRDANGKPVPVIVRDPAPAHLAIKILQSAVPGYADVKHVSLDAKVTGAVMRIAAPGQKDVPRVVQAPKQIEQIVDDDIVFDDDAPAPEIEQHAEQVAQTTVKLNDALKSESPEIIEMRRVAALPPDERRAYFAAKPNPLNPPRFVPMDERAEKIGHGEPAPGGYKIA